MIKAAFLQRDLAEVRFLPADTAAPDRKCRDTDPGFRIKVGHVYEMVIRMHPMSDHFKNLLQILLAGISMVSFDRILDQFIAIKKYILFCPPLS